LIFTRNRKNFHPLNEYGAKAWLEHRAFFLQNKIYFSKEIMKATVGDIIRIMENVAPAYLAEDWDNVGLQVGEKSWVVKRIMIALDPTLEVVKAACESNADLLIAHHPLIFGTLKKVDFSSPIGNIIRLAGKHKTSIYSAHTNLDNTKNGLNDILAKKVGLKEIRILRQSNVQGLFKLIVYVPARHENKILDALSKVDVGAEKDHKSVIFRHHIQEILKQGKASINEKSTKIDEACDVRIETTVLKENLSKVIDAIRALYLYEDMSYDVYPLITQETTNGTGRIGNLVKPERLSSYVKHIRKTFGVESVKVAGDPNLLVDRVAVCSGSGSGLIHEFISSGAQVYISGDLRYHDARSVEQAGLAIIDIGHFTSEFIIVDELVNRLRKIFDEEQIEVSVEACNNEKDPFWSIRDR
jgi:dinuclear metal center YbgI/SA1388 family protein